MVIMGFRVWVWFPLSIQWPGQAEIFPSGQAYTDNRHLKRPSTSKAIIFKMFKHYLTFSNCLPVAGIY